MKKYVDEEILNALTLRVDDLETGVWPLKQMYPIGSIYISIVETNPKDLFGFGEWEQIKDTFLLSAGDTYIAGATGGEATHKLTINEMPSHSHTLQNPVGPTGGSVAGYVWSQQIENWGNMAAKAVGGSQPHNNMPPYLTVYMWKRTA